MSRAGIYTKYGIAKSVKHRMMVSLPGKSYDTFEGSSGPVTTRFASQIFLVGSQLLFQLFFIQKIIPVFRKLRSLT